MGAFIEFLTGRKNKLLRDMLAASVVVALICVAAVTSINAAVTTFTASRQPMPPRIAYGQGGAGYGPVTTIMRSVLDDATLTGSIGGHRIVLDPCTGKEKK
ncbi:MAG: hypothetical protein IOC90_07350 [Methylocystis sp.]|jgi:hypothetical protein|nr:hypothetical protein [Methylocystis sp.]MCA3587834.1 hypothetical protein [Methylocystis sp.]MCA3590834.1 hypothetical protein [Methylocystis sp.]